VVNSRLIGSLLLGVLAMAGCSRGAGGGSGGGPLPGVARWYSQYRKPTSSNLRAVRAIDANTVIVAGEGSAIFRSDDGGATWVQLEHTPFGRGGDIAALDYFGANVHAVGSDFADPTKGRAWYAINGVLDWTTPDVTATGAAYTSVDVISPTDAFYLRSDGTIETVVADVVTGSSSIGVAGPWNALDMWGATGIGLAVGNGGLIRKKTASTAWTAPANPLPAAPNLTGISLINDSIAWVCGDNAEVWLSTDGFETWVRTLGPGILGSPSNNLKGVHFPVDVGTGWVVGSGGFIAATTNSGALWIGQTTPTIEDLYDVWFVNETVGYAVGDHGVVLKTTNSGVTWNFVPSPPPPLVQFNAVDFTNDGVRGLAGGTLGTLLRTVDGGTTWTATTTGIATPILGVAVPKSGTGLVAYACSTGGQVLKTTDFGATAWTVTTPGAAGGEDLNAILFPGDDTTGAIAGNAGKLLYTTTSGGTWTAATVAGTPVLRALSATPGGAAMYAAGDSSTILESTLAGIATWTVLPAGAPPITGGLALRAFTSPATGALFTGVSDTVHRKVGAGWASNIPLAGTVIDGLSWKSPTTGTFADVYAVATGTGRGVFYSEDDGTTWKRSYVHTKDNLHAIWMSPTVAGLGFAVGDNSTILKTTTGGK